MDDKTIEQMRKQHIDNYRKAILETIDNNTMALIEDVKLLIKKPPLEAMDLLKLRLLSLAKKNKTVLNTENLDKLLNDFRKELFTMDSKICDIRMNELSNIVNNIKLKEKEIIKLNKKDFLIINKKIKKIFKDEYGKAVTGLLEKIDSVFDEKIDVSIKDKIIKDYAKYVKSNYLKQLIDNFDIKVLVKDTTLINSVKEQADRYLFTLNNSRILNDLDN